MPVIGTDWWEPIYSTDNDDVVGQAKILIALGTDEQINNLKRERGFHFVTANYPHQNQQQSKLINGTKSVDLKIREKQISSNHKKEEVVETKQFCRKSISSDKTTQASFILKQDAASQCNVEVLYPREPTKQEMEDKQPPSSNITKELIDSFLSQLISQRQNVCVENSTNTEPNHNEGSIQNAQTKTNVQLKKTSDLLDSLEKAISIDNSQSTQDFIVQKGI